MPHELSFVAVCSGRVWGFTMVCVGGCVHVRAGSILAFVLLGSTSALAQDARAPVELPEMVVEAPAKKAPKKKSATKSKPAAASGQASGEPQPAEPAVDTAAVARQAEQAQAVGVGSKVPQSVQVIGRKQIEDTLKLTPSTSAAIARLVPGYSVSNGTVSGASETFRGRDVQVMLDGVVLNTPLRDVSRMISLIDLNNVERIEVIAGASSLYGSSATGGTINFVTLKPKPGKPTVTVNTSLTAFTENIGSSLQPTTSVSMTGKGQNGVDYVLSGAGRLADKTYDGAGREMPSDAMLGQGGGDRYESFNLLGKLGYDVNSHQRFEVSGTWIYFDQDPDYLTTYSLPFARPDFTSPYTGESVREDSKTFSARFIDQDTGLGKLTLVGFYNDINKRFNYSEFSAFNSFVYFSGSFADPTSPFNQTVLSSQRGGVNATMETSLNALLPGATLFWGGDIVHDETTQEMVDGRAVQTPLEQVSKAAFAQLQVPVGDRLTIRGGVRYEDFDLSVGDFTRPTAYTVVSGRQIVLPNLAVTGGDFNYGEPVFNLGATFKLTDYAELFGGFSQGFNLPDVGAFTRRAGANTVADIARFACVYSAGGVLLTPGCPAVRSVGFTDLAPETQIVDNYELGIRGATRDWRGSLTGFVSTSENGVNFDPGSNTISQQKEEIYGVEFAGEVSVTRALSLGTIFTWREGRYDSDTIKDGKIDSHLPNNRIATPYRGTIYGDYRFFNNWVFHLEGEWWSDRNEAINKAGTRFPIDGAFLVNAALAAPLYDGQVYLGATNLFDAEYENPTATSVRNLDVQGLGRTVTVGYRKTF